MLSVGGPLRRAVIARLRAELRTWRVRGVLELRVELSGLSNTDPDLAWALARMLSWARTQLRALGGDVVITGAGARLSAELDKAATLLGSPPPAQHALGRPYRPESADQP